MGNGSPVALVNAEIDAYDMAIISALSENARLTTMELSRIVHLSRTAVARRVTRLQDLGVIEPGRCDVNYAQLGFAVRAFVELAAPKRDSFEVRDRLLERPEVLNLSIVLGDHLILAEVIAVDTQHLHRFLTWLNDIGYSETKVVLKQHRSALTLRERLEMLEKERQSTDPRLQDSPQEA
jgi:DNA-binding Lrp family transcriptional regulator